MFPLYKTGKKKKQELSPFGEYSKAMFMFSSFLNVEVLLHGVFVSELPKGYKMDSSQIF